MVPERPVDLKVVPGYGPEGSHPSGAEPAPGRRPLFGRHAEPPARVATPLEAGLRPADALVLIYLAVTVCLMVALQSNVRAWGALALAHVVAGALLLRVAAAPPSTSGLLRVVRDFYPLPALVLFYAEYAWLTKLTGPGTHDAVIVHLEQQIFGMQPSRELRHLLPWPWLSQYLHGAYFCYYLVPVLLTVTLYAQGRWRAFQESLTTLLLAFFTCGLVFIAFPVAGPYHFFGAPALGNLAGPMSAITHGIIERGSSVGTAFPSSHTAVAVAVWLTALRLSPRVFWIQALIVPALVVGTVYGGFHYALDAMAGIVCGVGAGLVGPRLNAFLAHRLPRSGAIPRVTHRVRLPRAGGES